MSPWPPTEPVARRVRRRMSALTFTASLFAASVFAGGMPTAQFLEQHGSGAAFATGDFVSVSAGTGLDTGYRFFIEVPPGLPLLQVDLFDADIGLGGGGEIYDRASGGFNTAIRYTLLDPLGTTVATVTGNNAGPAGSNNAWISLYNTAAPQNGHWQLIVDSSSAVTTGDDRAGYSVRAHDGDASGLGAELNIYSHSFQQMGVHAGAAVTWSLFPYITAGGSTGFEAESNDFDLDGSGGISITSRTAAFVHTNPAVSTDGLWRNEPFSGWTSDYVADDYGVWSLSLRVASAPNYVTYYLSDWRAANPEPSAQPEANTYRVYLQSDAGTAPSKPWVSQMLSWMAGPNPPIAGSTTTVRIQVRVANPTAQPITFGVPNQVDATVPGGGATFSGNESAAQGNITATPLVGGTGVVTWDPVAIAAGSTAILSYDVDVTPTAAAQRVEVTGNPGAGGTTAVYVDETGNLTQAQATYLFGPLAALVVTEGALLPGDTDGDGIPDLVEGGTDTDGDGRPDNLDLDADDDGIEDSVEGLTQSDGDGIPDYIDPDSDGDGVWDLIEGNDANRDGVTDYPVIDANDDGRIDAIADIDSDGLDDAYDTSVAGSSAATQNSDLDPLRDWRDIDDDGDGIPTANEDGNGNGDWADDDPDADGRPAYLDIDADGDGIPDATELTGDADNDGTPDFLDLDSDNDGVPDAVEGPGDRDNDGVADYVDLDSDNDGIPDTVESGAPDADRDGIIDGFLDLDGDGMHDPLATTPLPVVDRDGDGVVDRLDLDSDNDGVPDTIESGAPDADGDGLIDGLVDVDGDGLHDPLATTPLPAIDGDGDLVVDRLDLDADNDGIPDTIESGAPDSDLDGRVDPFLDGNGNGLADSVDPAATPPGTTLAARNGDSDAVIDRHDVDADDDGITDCREAAGPDPGPDADGDGRIDGFSDANGNGFADVVDPAATPAGVPLAVTNTDGLDEPDYLDVDSDNDALTDVVEGFDPDRAAGGTDGDGDGLDDSWDLDAGGIIADLPDDDGDLLRDWRDPLSCLVANIPPLTPLHAVRVGGDVRLTWPGAVDAEGYNTWVVDGNATASNTDGIPIARAGGPWPAVVGCFGLVGTTCLDVGAIAGADDDIKSYQVRGVCGMVEAAE